MINKFHTFLFLFSLLVIVNAQVVKGKIINQRGEGIASRKLKLYSSPNVFSTITKTDGSFSIEMRGTNVEEGELPTGYTISNNYPNPFNPTTRIDIMLPQRSRIQIDLFNILGQEVQNKITKDFKLGLQHVDLELNGLANGIYFARINIDDKYFIMRKLLLMYGSRHLVANTTDLDYRMNKSGTAINIDSIVVDVNYVGRVVFKTVRPVDNNFLDLGNLTVNLPPEAEDINLAFKRNEKIGKGMNFGNALEAPNEGDWGMTIKESYIEELSKAGFNSVRLPICWSAHTSQLNPYVINSSFLNRVDEIIRWCNNKNLAVIITIHHFNEFYDSPDDPVYRAMFFAIWKQLANHFVTTDPGKLFFELLNEPHSNLTPSKWNILLPEIIDSVRSIDSKHTLIIDPPEWASHYSLRYLQIPDSERNAIVSVRYYLPYQFTHQGAHWVDGSDVWLGTTWRGTSAERDNVSADLTLILDWANKNNRPITIGEWGTIEKADSTSRVTWTTYVRNSIEKCGFSWNYFDFGVIFKSYDIEQNKWLTGFLDAFFSNTASGKYVLAPMKRKAN